MENWDPRSPMMTRQGANHGIGNICPISEGSNRNWVGPGVELGDYVYLHGGEGNGLVDIDQAIYKLRKEVGNEWRSEEHTSELQSLLRISHAAFCFQKTITTI